MISDQNHESLGVRPPLGPPEGLITGVRFIFWNERELRAGWRLLVYVLLVVVFSEIGAFLAMALHLPQFSEAGVTATSILAHDGLGFIAVFAAAAIMGMLESRPFEV